MEGNKEESSRCRALAKKFFDDGNYERALNLINKAERMFSCTENQILLEKIKKSNTHTPTSSSSSSPSTSSYSPPSPSASPSENYSEEQSNVCQRVMNTENYYEILGIEKNANEETIKRAYKNLAKQLHPDKNKYPSAEEAFKKVSKSATCLLNPNRRHVYDTYGEESPSNQLPNRSYGEEITPEQLFEAFFGPSTRIHHGRSGFVFTNARRPQSQSSHSNLVQFIPIILFILVSIFAHFFQGSEKPKYLFHPSPQYPVKLISAYHNITYYVDFDTENEIKYNQFAQQKLDYMAELSYFEKECIKEREDLQYQYYGYPPRYQRSEAKRIPEKCNTFHALRKDFNRMKYYSKK